MSADNYGVTNLTVGLDESPPTYSNVGQSKSIVEQGESLLLYAYWEDNVGLSYAWIESNETGSWKNNSLADIIKLNGISDWAVFSVDTKHIPPNTTVGWRIYANDSNGNINRAYSMTFRVVEDRTPPSWSEIYTNPNSPAPFSPTNEYHFNVIWMDSVGIDTVLIENNFSGIMKNYTMKNNSHCSYCYSYNATKLSVGRYIWRSNANDSSGNWNSTPWQIYEVIKGNPNLTLLLNETNGDRVYNKSEKSANITAYLNISDNISISDNLTIKITTNETEIIANGPPPQSIIQDISYLDVGRYNITAYFSGNENYTSDRVTHFIIISNISNNITPDNTPPSFSNLIYPSSPIIYQTGRLYQFNATVSDNSGISTIEFYFNNTKHIPYQSSYNNYYYTLYDLPAGNYSFYWHAVDTYNNSDSTPVKTLEIERVPTEIALYLNGMRGNKTYLQGEMAVLTAILNISNKIIQIQTDFMGTIIGGTPLSVSVHTGSVDAGKYTVTAIYLGDINHRSSNETWYLTIRNTTRLHGRLTTHNISVNATISFYSGDAIVTVISNQDYDVDIPPSIYNITVSAFDNRFNLNLSNVIISSANISNFILLDLIPTDIDMGLPSGIEFIDGIYGIVTAFNFTNATVNIRYINIEKNIDESTIIVYRCPSIYYNYTSRSCSKWFKIDDIEVSKLDNVIVIKFGLDSLSAFAVGSVKKTTVTLPAWKPSYGSYGGAGAGSIYQLEASCYDGIKNCHDNVCEEGVDCGGPCKPCPSCSDGIQNQGEEGIDCGGPCKPCITTTITTTTTTISIQISSTEFITPSTEHITSTTPTAFLRETTSVKKVDLIHIMSLFVFISLLIVVISYLYYRRKQV